MKPPKQATVFEAMEFARSYVGVEVDSGIAWVWARGFSHDGARQFVAWLDQHGFEHRGVYRGRTELHSDVRFREGR